MCIPIAHILVYYNRTPHCIRPNNIMLDPCNLQLARHPNEFCCCCCCCCDKIHLLERSISYSLFVIFRPLFCTVMHFSKSGMDYDSAHTRIVEYYTFIVASDTHNKSYIAIVRSRFFIELQHFLLLAFPTFSCLFLLQRVLTVPNAIW